MRLQKPLLDKELWAAWEASGGTVLLSNRRLLDKVEAQFPGVPLRFTNSQWDEQRRKALERLGLPSSECGRWMAGALCAGCAGSNWSAGTLQSLLNSLPVGKCTSPLHTR